MEHTPSTNTSSIIKLGNEATVLDLDVSIFEENVTVLFNQ